MTHLIFHHDLQKLPKTKNDLFPVQLYGRGSNKISSIGNAVIDKVQRLGVAIPPQAMDLLTIALAVTAADTFVRRSESPDGWARQFRIQLPLFAPARWMGIRSELQRALNFLSGDTWEFEFLKGGLSPPIPYRRKDRYRLTSLRGLDCVCLFSGGLDSAIGAIDLLEQGRAPLLISHAYRGDKIHQDEVARQLQGKYSRFEVNTDPHRFNSETDITMRTRSFNFLALAAVGACGVQAINQKEYVDLIVPENGFISLNAPLTLRRIGTLSTRTTHPNFINAIQTIFEATKIPCRITNPYQFKTKGQMVLECHNQQLLATIADNTVSCSHWKRSNQQCGVCVPCIIRRASLYAGKIPELTQYKFDDISDVMSATNLRDDVLALSLAITKKESQKLGPWIMNSGALPQSRFSDFKRVFLDGLNEVEVFLKAQGVV